MAMTKVKSLQLWCKKMTEGYKDVNVVDMTKSWKDGLACCAIIHRFRPDLIDFDALSKENVFENNQLAFTVAESELDIPALLDAPDMVAMKVPDKLSVVTYVSQYYNYFHNKPQLGGPGVKKASGVKRHQDNEELPGPEAKRLTLNKPKNTKDRQVSMGDKCTICHGKVYLLERHVEENKLYHRTCFRRSDLSPTNKIYDRPLGITPTRRDDESNVKDLNSQPNFWSRRAEARKNENLENKIDSAKSDSVVDKKSENEAFGTKDINIASGLQKSKYSSYVKEEKKDDSKVPAWKKSRPEDLKLTKVDESNSVKNDLPDSYKSSSSSVAKLKHFLKSDDDVKNSENDQKSNVLSKKEQFHPKPTPRHAVQSENKEKLKDIQKDKLKNKDLKFKENEKMDTSEIVFDNESNRKSRPMPVPRAAQRKSPGIVSASDLSPSSSSPPPLPSTAPPPVKTVVGSPESPRHKVSPFLSPKEGHKPPPSRPKSSPVVINLSQESSKSPVLHPFSTTADKFSKDKVKSHDKSTVLSKNKKDIDVIVAPVKPKRMSQNLNQGAQIVPTAMDVDEPPTAYIVTPKADVEEDKVVLGSLLQSLANVRRTKSPDEPRSSHLLEKPMEVDKPGGVSKTAKISKGASDAKTDKDISSKPINITKGAIDSKSDIKNIKNKQNVNESNRDKTTFLGKDKSKMGFVSNKLSVFSEDNGAILNKKSESHISVKPSTGDNKKASVESEIPSWKQKTELNHPKSTDILSSGKIETSHKTEWQIQADKRKAALEDKLKPRPKSVASVLDSTKQESVLKSTKPETVDKRLLNDKKIPARPKSADLLSRNDGTKVPKADWQMEAEKRMAARQGGYADPEKPNTAVQSYSKEAKLDHKISPTIPKRPDLGTGHKVPVLSDSEEKHIDINKKLSQIADKKEKKSTDDKVKENGLAQIQVKRRVLPSPPKEEVKTKFEKKKISVGMNFNFDASVDLEEDKKEKSHKPPLIKSPLSPASPLGGHTPPPRPPPPRKEADRKRLSPLEIQEQLVNIDDKLTKLEVRGRQLEDSIRKAQEESEDETQMIEWFKLVNDKNELVRKEADLIYASRQQELEDEQHELDQRMRHLMKKPDSEKTEEELKEEEYLLQKLVDTVNQRSLIVDSQDEDRIRYEQEDRDIAEVLAMKGFMKDNSTGILKKQKKKKGKR